MPPLYGGGFGVALVQLLLFYYGCGALLHYVIPSLFPIKPIQPTRPTPEDIRRDALCSIGPVCVKAAVWTVVEVLHAHGLTQTYVGPIVGIKEVLYAAWCVLILDYLHDAWFYWTHRLLHWKPLYIHVHYMHHRSKAPSAFTGYSFHVLEAVLVFFNEILVCWMFPIHMGVHRVYHILTTLIHEGGHAGYELSPFIPTLESIVSFLLTGLRGSNALNTVQHHDMHHRFPTKHFSLYFTHWDRWMGTLHAKYDAELFRYFG